ncbi:MAG: ABC transporter substrate-binding protein [Chloroflexi bacterium RIFCSPLOWO2_12_FULL_71_12]|nr:MAG: ABC transporter substrate-binding protein [Chloroflexi bacterium GWC2_70_10]OGO74469.1 MAG: ABC transporter substrate-binding protein [Chloroflexi bacterium RIFCSPLOWO2_12_FULL_71_12]
MHPRMLAVSASILGLMLAACGGTAAPGATYKIGAIFDATGPASSLGVPERDTVKMLEAELNAKGGIKGPDGLMHKVEVVFYDNQSQESQSVLVAKRLIEEDKVPVIIGPSQSGTTLAIVDTTQKAQIPLISAAASFKIVEPVADRKWVFKTPQSDSLIMENALAYHKKAGHTKLAWISVNNAFGDSGRAELQRLAPKYGVTVVADERFGATDTDMTAQLTKIRASGADCLQIWAIPPAASTVTKNAFDLGLKLPVFQSHGIGNQTFIDLAGPSANGVIFPVGKLLVASSLPDSDPQKTVLVDYTAAYKTAYGKLPTTFGGHAWDAFWIAVKAMEKAGPDSAKIRDEIEKIRNFVGVTGVFDFSATDHNGLDNRAVTMVKIDGGTWKPAE